MERFVPVRVFFFSLASLFASECRHDKMTLCVDSEALPRNYK
jgi:hypothetical protein